MFRSPDILGERNGSNKRLSLYSVHNTVTLPARGRVAVNLEDHTKSAAAAKERIAAAFCLGNGKDIVFKFCIRGIHNQAPF